MRINLNKIHNGLLTLLQANKPFPLDKILIIPYIFFLYTCKHIKLFKTEKLILGILFFTTTLSFLINYPNGSIQIYYPIFFLSAGLLATHTKINLLVVRKILSINIIFGLGATIAAFLGFENEFSYSLREKMLPYIYGPYGLSPTQQVYGTFCILIQIISFEYKKYDWLFVSSLICMIFTLNRCTLLFFGILLFVYKRKYFISLCIIGIITIINYWDIISSIMFSTTNLESRDDLRKGAEISFWKSNDMIIYLFGRGNTNTTENIAARTYWERTYIEHGLDFILHCYGYIGLTIIVILILGFIFKLIRKKQLGYALIITYYLMIEPFFTHEFLASSFFYFVLIILHLSKIKSNVQLYPITA